jgi:glycosyltransferase involved in cell wall biosynthesis
MIAARLAGVKKRIYSRHHAAFHHEYFPAAIKYDRFVNFLSTDIVAISEVVKKVLLDYESVSPRKVHVIHHGFDLEAFRMVSEEKITAMRKKYLPESAYPVIGLISRYIEWKGVQYVIPAFAELLKVYPKAHLIIANARGYYGKEVSKLLEKIPLGSYTEIPFEGDLFSLYKLFDVFVHVPVSYNTEAFGQTYVEALAAEIPSVFTLSGVAPEFIKDRVNAVVVDYKNSKAIYNAVIELLENEPLKNTLIRNGLKSVEPFSLDIFISKLEELYS